MPAAGKHAAHDAEAPDAGASPARGWMHRLRKHWVLTLVAVSLLVHGVGFSLAQRSKAESGPVSPEVELGRFTFLSADVPQHDITSAGFDLHIHLLHPNDPSARKRLMDNRFRLQQDIEQLVRQARGGDFADPTLAEFKRQLQRQVNETLGFKAVDDVIITDLSIVRRTGAAGNVEETAETPASTSTAAAR